MAEKVDETTEVAAEKAERRPLLQTARKVLLALLGAVALAQEELEELTQKLIERGEITEQDGKKMMRDVTEKRRERAKRAEGEVDKRIEEMVGRTGVPTKADIDALSDKITILTEKVDELKGA